MTETNFEIDSTEGEPEDDPVTSRQETREAAEAPLVSGSLWSAIWIMSWPLVITTVAGSIVGLVDVQVSGYIGSSAQAAVGLSEHVIFLFMIFLMSIGVGTTAIVSRKFGEGDREQAIYATGQSLCLSILTGIVLSLLSLVTAHYLLPMFTRSPDVLAQGVLYLSVFGIYLIPFSLICIANAAFRAIGDARTPLAVVTCEVVINVAGDYLTVLGNWPVPGLGIKGIALSAIAGAFAAAALAVYRIRQSPLRDSLKRLWPVSLGAVNSILNIGVPSAFQRLAWAASVFVLFFVLSRVKDPTAGLASWTIGMRVEGLLFMPLMALSLAVGSIVGQSLGAGQVDRAFKAGWHVTAIGVVMMIVLSVALFLAATPLAGWMSRDPSTIAYSADYLRINALAEPFLAVNMILSGALQGAGDTKIPMWVTIFSNWAIRLPLAWTLALFFGLGPFGVWVAMSISILISAILITIRFQTGGWATTRV